MKEQLETLSRRWLSPKQARLAKRASVGLRYRAQARACRRGYRTYGDRYPNPVLFVAGLPKSGTTWLERMITGYPGYHELLIPEVAAYELATGGSHGYPLPKDMFDRFRRMLVLTKMHVHGSVHNAEVLREAGVPYVVLYRDLRDVAVSNYFYVRNTPWHPEHEVYRGRSVEEGLEVFAARTLPAYAAWVRSWRANRDPEESVEIRYEEMVADARAVLVRVAEHFGLGTDEPTIDRIIESTSFGALSRGRSHGDADEGNFFRKGVAGDWVTQFTPRLRDVYKKAIGEFLIEFGYEKDLSW